MGAAVARKACANMDNFMSFDLDKDEVGTAKMVAEGIKQIA
jgi:hypothetical protein